MKIGMIDEYRVEVGLSRTELELLEDLLQRRIEESPAPYPPLSKMLESIKALKVLLKAHNEGFPG